MRAPHGQREIRSLRAQLKRDLKAGKVTIGAVLVDPPPYLETAKVLDMALALPKVGSVKAIKILSSCRVSPSKTFGGLSDRKRAEASHRAAAGYFAAGDSHPRRRRDRGARDPAGGRQSCR